MSNLIYSKSVTRADGAAVTPAEVRDSLSQPLSVNFDYNGFKDFTVFFDPTKVSLEAALAYQCEQTRLANSSPDSAALIAESEDLAPELERIQQLGEDASDAEAEALVGAETLKRINGLMRRLVLHNAESEPTLFPLRITMLAPAIIEWNLPDFTPSIETFQSSAALAKAVIPALWDAYHPTLSSLEAVTEKTPNPSGADSANTSRSAKASSRKDS